MHATEKCTGHKLSMLGIVTVTVMFTFKNQRISASFAYGVSNITLLFSKEIICLMEALKVDFGGTTVSRCNDVCR